MAFFSILTRINLILLLIVIILVRVFLLNLSSFEMDMNSWKGWATRLSEVGPTQFYNQGYFADYFPGFLYILWIYGKIFHLILPSISFFSLPFELVLKFITTLFDIGTAFFIYKIINLYNKKWALIASIFYLGNPALIFNSSVWGQVDGIVAFFLITSHYYLFELKKKIHWSIFYSLAFLTKPQSLILLPIALVKLFVWEKNKSFIYLLLLALLSLLFAFPFFTTNPIFGLVELLQKSFDVYPYTSLFAFNFWALVGWWKFDNLTFILPYQTWGTILFFITAGLSLIPLVLNKKDGSMAYLSSALVFLSFFTFSTRIHERYLFPFFALLIIVTTMQKSFKLLGFYIVLSTIHLANLWYVYYYYNFLFNKPDVQPNLIYNLIDRTYPLLSIITILSFFALLFMQYKNINFSFFKKISLYKLKINTKFLLISILLLTFVLRIALIWYPSNYVFDEVYHGFTSKEFAKGSKEAWEWWTTPPKGVAFEWTHPPLAKEIMAVSLKVFNTTAPWGWRLPGVVLGVISVYLVFLIASRLFNEKIALLSAFIFSLDGLNFVQSRTGMNDIYLVTFILACLFFLLKNNLVISSIFLGLAIASKWTGIYFLIFVFVFLILRKQFKYLLLFLIIPSLVYLSSYLPFFQLDHTTSQFKELQKQMWWYHTNLKATHGYSSPWWSWPLSLYPVWYFVDYHKDGKISNIFASGNLAVFWMGFIAIISSLLEIVISLFKTIKSNLLSKTVFIKTYQELKINRNLLLVLFGYFLFILPWSISPRIMFLYHYSPSIPFLSIILAYQISQLNNSKLNKVAFYTLVIIIFLSFLLLYPFLVGIPLSKDLIKLFFTTNLSTNPFGN